MYITATLHFFFLIMSDDKLESPNYDKISDSEVKEAKTSCIEILKVKLNDQDFQQKISVSITFMLELYRVLMGGMLVMFVPQKCGDSSCSITDNISRTDDLSIATVAFNVMTFLCFFGLYIVEIGRAHV